MQGRIALTKGQEAPSGNPIQKRGAQGISGIRAAFSLGTFFWRRKRKYLAFGCENPIKSTRRDSDTKNIPKKHRLHPQHGAIQREQNHTHQALGSKPSRI